MQKQKELYEFKARLQFPGQPRLHCETLSLKKKMKALNRVMKIYNCQQTTKNRSTSIEFQFAM